MVQPGQLVVYLGANGAGKTTVLRCISRMLPVDGELTLDGQSIRGRSTEDVAHLGVGHVPEGRGTFTDLTGARKPDARSATSTREAFAR